MTVIVRDEVVCDDRLVEVFGILLADELVEVLPCAVAPLHDFVSGNHADLLIAEVKAF